MQQILLAFALAATEPPGDLWQAWERTFTALPALSRAAIERCADEMGDDAEQRDKLACRHLDHQQRNNAALLWYYRRYAPSVVNDPYLIRFGDHDGATVVVLHQRRRPSQRERI